MEKVKTQGQELLEKRAAQLARDAQEDTAQGEKKVKFLAKITELNVRGVDGKLTLSAGGVLMSIRGEYEDGSPFYRAYGNVIVFRNQLTKLGALPIVASKTGRNGKVSYAAHTFVFNELEARLPNVATNAYASLFKRYAAQMSDEKQRGTARIALKVLMEVAFAGTNFGAECYTFRAKDYPAVSSDRELAAYWLSLFKARDAEASNSATIAAPVEDESAADIFNV